MGEAAALALGASIVQALQIPYCNFLSDSQQLVHFLNKTRPSGESNRLHRFSPILRPQYKLSSSRSTEIKIQQLIL
jgi:hypothetical protein